MMHLTLRLAANNLAFCTILLCVLQQIGLRLAANSRAFSTI